MNFKNKARLLLFVIGIFAIVGVSMAFKARATDFVWVATTTAPTTNCPVQQFGVTIGLPGQPGTFTIRGATNPAQPCKTITVKAGL